MNKNLLIVGAGTYAVMASEIASDMGCFEKISFIDDERKITQDSVDVIGIMRDIDKLAIKYSNIVVAIEDPEVRLLLLNRIRHETPCRIVSLISPKAYISPSAQIMDGCIIEPMAVVHTGSVIAVGCAIAAGGVVSYASMCCDGVHIGCNATVEKYCLVPAGTRICSGEVYIRKNSAINEDLFFNPQSWAENLNDISKHVLKVKNSLE